MRFPRVLPTLTVTAACALGAVPAASAAESTDVSQSSSSNWSGYVAGSDSSDFKSVTGSWTQPTADCSSGQRTYAAFWVGLGGSGESSTQGGTGKLEQAGTQSNCSADGRATYTAWYELVPSAPVTVDLAVHAGDRMTATTTVDGDRVTNSVVNHTTGRSFTKTVTMSGADTSSAEWIAEAPSACRGSLSSCEPLPLSDFGTVDFSGASATDSSGHTGSISDSRWSATAVTLDPSASQGGFAGYGGDYGQAAASTGQSGGGAQPGQLSSDGSAFAVAYAADTSTSAAGGSGSGSASGGSGYGYGGGSGYGAGGGYGYRGGSDAGDGSGYGYGDGSGYGYGDGSGYGAGGDPYGESSGGYGDSGGYGYVVPGVTVYGY